MASYGEFIEALKKTENIEAQAFMERRIGTMAVEEWGQFETDPLTEELISAFAQNVIVFFHMRSVHIYNFDIRNRVLEQGHNFLREIHARAEEFGFFIDVDLIDMPITFREANHLVNSHKF